MNNTKKQLIATAVSALSLSSAIKLVNDAFGEALELKKFSADTGANIEEMQRWKAVADQMSGSGAAVAESIRAITSNQEKIKLGQGNISGYQLLGIDPRQDPFEVLEQLRKKTQGLSQAMKKNVLGQFGVSGDMISTLDMTNEEFDRMAKRAWVISPSSVEGMNKARGSLSELKNMVSFFKAEIATKLSPVITRIVKSFTDWARQNKEGIIKGIQKAFEVVQRFVQMIVRAAMYIDKLIKSTIGWKAAIIAIVGVLALMNAGFLLSPIGLFTAAIILLVAVLEDLQVYSEGGDSLFGVLVKQFPGLIGIIKPFADTLRDILSLIGALFKGDWAKFDEITNKWGAWGEILQKIRDAFQDISGFVSAILSGDWSGFMDTFNKKHAVDTAGNRQTIGDIFSGKVNFMDELKRELADPFGKNKLKAVPYFGGGAGAANSAVININGVSDPDRAAKMAWREFHGFITKAQMTQKRVKAEK
jgi:hypothetical protein